MIGRPFRYIHRIVKRKRNFARGIFNPVHTSKAPHEFLKREGTTVGSPPPSFPVQLRNRRAVVLRDADYFRQARGYFSQTTAPYSCSLAFLVNLHSRAVVFVFQPFFHRSFQNLVEVFRGSDSIAGAE